MKDQTNASAHFTWDELLVSATAPDIAAHYRNKYPNGGWPALNNPELWTGLKTYTYSDFQKLEIMAAPWITQRPVSENMADHINRLAEPIRTLLGRPLKVISGWRPPALNEAVGGARLSGHLLGVATDIAATGAESRRVREWALQRDREKRDIGFFKIYSWGFHIASPRGFNDHIIK